MMQTLPLAPRGGWILDKTRELRPFVPGFPLIQKQACRQRLHVACLVADASVLDWLDELLRAVAETLVRANLPDMVEEEMSAWGSLRVPPPEKHVNGHSPSPSPEL